MQKAEKAKNDIEKANVNMVYYIMDKSGKRKNRGKAECRGK